MKLSLLIMRFFLLIVILFLLRSFSYADIIYLRNGEKIEGKIIEKTDKYIKIDFMGVALTYWLDEIQDIKGSSQLSSTSGILLKETTERIDKAIDTQEKESSYYDDVPRNELPMYGNIPRTPAERELDEKYINIVIEGTGGREVAVEETLKLAWKYFNNGDPKTAMKRFNQAWLLDPQNAEVFYGFGFLLQEKGDYDEAITMHKKALDLNPQHGMALGNLGRSYKEKAMVLARQFGRSKEQEIENYLVQASQLYEKASQYATVDKDLSYIYYQWSVLLTMMGNFKEAWDKIHLSRKYGGQFIENGFIQQLSQDMPEP